jgi:hypothetical protein
MVCIDENGWGVCKRCSDADGEHNTLLGCPCGAEDDCESASEPGLACFGEDFGGGIGFCWDSQDGPPVWQCVEGSCGQAPYYTDDDEMYCEHYPEPPVQARCEPWGTCNSILARVCAGQNRICECIDEEPGPPLTCSGSAGGCTEDDCCVEECEQDADCGIELGYPSGYTCEGAGQGALRCVEP